MTKWANMQEALGSELTRVKLIEHKLLGHTCSNCDYFRKGHARREHECDHPIHPTLTVTKADNCCIRWENRNYDDH